MCALGFFPLDTPFFGEGVQKSMVNFLVDDLDGLITNRVAAGVRIDPLQEDRPDGKFAWIRDPKGNRIEIWQPPAAL